LKNTLISTSAVLALFLLTYASTSILGYDYYEVQIASAVVIGILGMVFVSLKSSYGGSQIAKFSMVLSVGLILLEEILLNSTLALYGMVLAIVGLILFPALGAMLKEDEFWPRVALESAALILVTRVVLSPFPVSFLSNSAFLPVIYALILLALVIYLRSKPISAKQARITSGSRSVILQVGAGLAIGLIVGLTEYQVLMPQPLLAGAGLIQMLAYVVIVTGIMVSVVEELLFRGLLQSSLEKTIPAWQAIQVSSLLFGLMHFGWMNPFEMLLAYGTGVVFGYVSTFSNSLLGPMTAHAFGNVVLYLIAFFRA